MGTAKAPEPDWTIVGMMMQDIAQQRQVAEADLAQATEIKSQGDMANLMARYGSQLALAGQSHGSILYTMAHPVGAGTAGGMGLYGQPR